ncbi:DUF2490 domain-containing protein [Runella sp. CRIBMP]|uniref:DUF2490 domain-containing protein n=1 Tax=Runella sp. CRIBMP TaxID=2683261 RepID=UPI0014130947|nr:DUF2490 domain-containing protein [Runella sp. CRIBMP]NBB23007.1 DUF2490 domain-containing protein [Runella sp. CRIBMP]
MPKLPTDEQQVWARYFNQTRLSDKWGLWGDFHFRTTDHFIKEPSKGIIRLGLMYCFKDDLKFTNGYAFINHFPEEGHANVSMPEHRIWHQIQLHNKYGKVRTMQWTNVYDVFEQNRLFVGLDYNFNSHAHVQLGYMNVYQQFAAGSKFKYIHSIRVFFFQNLDFLKTIKQALRP